MPGPMELIGPSSRKAKGHPLAYVGDVVGTGSSRKSAINSVLWHIGDDIPYVPNKRSGGVSWAARSRRSSSTRRGFRRPADRVRRLKMQMGDVITISPTQGKIERAAGEPTR
jgi:aconitate hydratase 2 / 2-methylisocitrate dehydratase